MFRIVFFGMMILFFINLALWIGGIITIKNNGFNHKKTKQYLFRYFLFLAICFVGAFSTFFIIWNISDNGPLLIRAFSQTGKYLEEKYGKVDHSSYSSKDHFYVDSTMDEGYYLIEYTYGENRGILKLNHNNFNENKTYSISVDSIIFEDTVRESNWGRTNLSVGDDFAAQTHHRVVR